MKNKIWDIAVIVIVVVVVATTAGVAGWMFAKKTTVTQLAIPIVTKTPAKEESVKSEPFSYSMTGVSASVSKNTAPFTYTADQLKSMAEECGSQHEIGYFDKLVAKFSGATKTIYNFKYQGDSQDAGIYTVTLLPNNAGYISLEHFKKDFDICAAGGNAYPTMLNSSWLLFVNACGSGFDDDSGRPHGCDEVKKVVEPSLKLNQTTTPVEEKDSNAPQWLTYNDQDISFQYPKTLCGTSWQEEWDTRCDEEWEVERTVGHYSSNNYTGGEKDPAVYIHIIPSYSTFGFEFGGDIKIIFVSKEIFNKDISNKSLQQQITQRDYKIYTEKGIEGYPDKIDNFYLTDGSKYIVVRNNFPDRYPKYFLFLLDSIELK